MAIIGFIFLVLIGVYFMGAAITAAYVCIGFSGQIKGSDKFAIALFVALSAACLTTAYMNAPFTIVGK